MVRLLATDNNRLRPLGENEKHKIEMEKSKYVNKSEVYRYALYSVGYYEKRVVLPRCKGGTGCDVQDGTRGLIWSQ